MQRSNIKWQLAALLIHALIVFNCAAMLLVPRYFEDVTRVWVAYTASSGIIFLNVVPVYGWVVLIALNFAMRIFSRSLYLVFLMGGLTLLCLPLASGVIYNGPAKALIGLALAATVSLLLGLGAHRILMRRPKAISA